MISENDIKALGIDFIDVNLSALQCMQKNLSDMFIEIMQKYNVPKGTINLEVTETDLLHSGNFLYEIMEDLKPYGVTFSLDDYGSGFASVNYLAKYPFNIVKVDRELLLNSEKDAKSKIIFEQTANMIKSLNMDMIAEGVETNAQAEKMKDIGCHFVQGFYYARPMDEGKFIDFIRQNQGNNINE